MSRIKMRRCPDTTCSPCAHRIGSARASSYSPTCKTPPTNATPPTDCSPIPPASARPAFPRARARTMRGSTIASKVRPGRARRLGGSRVFQLPWQQVLQPYAPLEVLSADQIEAIHLTSLRILEELGMEVMSPRARALLKGAGAEVNAATSNARLDRGLVEAALQTAPACFVLTPRNTARRVILGGNHVNFGLVAGPPNVHDCERGR